MVLNSCVLYRTMFCVYSEPLPVQCSFCERHFRSLAALNGHMRLHGGYVKRVCLNFHCSYAVTFYPCSVKYHGVDVQIDVLVCFNCCICTECGVAINILIKSFVQVCYAHLLRFWLFSLILGPFCRVGAFLQATSRVPRWWIGERPPDMAASCDIYK